MPLRFVSILPAFDVSVKSEMKIPIRMLFKNKIFDALARFASCESGATAIEYGLIGGLIAVVIIGAVELVGTSISGKFNQVSTALGSTTTPPASPTP